MLRCPKCGTDNMLTAIFCRGCGERLNLDEIRPDDFANIAPKKQDNTKQNIIGGAIIAFLAVFFLIDVMFPSCGKIATTEDDVKAATDKAVAALFSDQRGALTFEDKDVTALVNETLKEKEGGGAEGEEGKDIKAAGTPCTIRFLDDNKCKAIFPMKLWGMPVNVTVTHTISAENGKFMIGGEDTSYKVGLGIIPLYPAIKDNETWIKIWGNYVSFWSFDQYVPIAEVKTEKGQVTITPGTGAPAQGIVPSMQQDD